MVWGRCTTFNKSTTGRSNVRPKESFTFKLAAFFSVRMNAFMKFCILWLNFSSRNFKLVEKSFPNKRFVFIALKFVSMRSKIGKSLHSVRRLALDAARYFFHDHRICISNSPMTNIDNKLLNSAQFNKAYGMQSIKANQIRISWLIL